MPLYDFHCPDCGAVFEEIVPSTQSTTPCECDGTADRQLSARIGLLNDPNKRAEALKKRSEKHSVNEMRKNPERLAKLTGRGVQPKAQTPWNIRNK